LRVFYLHLDFLNEQGRVLPMSSVRQPELPAVVTDLTSFESLARQVIEGHSAKTETGLVKRDLALRLLLIHIEEAARVHPARSDGTKLAAVLLAVQENPGLPWPGSEMARQAGLSVSQTARRMRELTGQSPREYVIRARIERARRLMEESALSLKQIAESLGYSDVYFFHRQFKTVTGMTPGQWSRSLRKSTA
jgi:AraC-like DNA-binding protein